MRRKSIGRSKVPAKNPDKVLTREEVLILLGKTIEEQAAKVSTGRVRNPEIFSQKIRAVRALFYSANVYFAGLKDEELSNVLKELEELEELANAEQKH